MNQCFSMQNAAARLRLLPTAGVLFLPDLTLAQASPFLTGANALQTNILAWLTPVAIILVMVHRRVAQSGAHLQLKNVCYHSFHPDQAAPQLSEETHHFRTPLGLAQHSVAVVTEPVDLKDLLCQIKPKRRNAHRGRSCRFEWFVILPLWHI
jgi:hypothetical protein